ncbi:hypothetical protein L3Q82_006327 [Scortum barcoo]|uniref:Uncharacterized protein n=1 Tax=Scortum barcoo TaxID=214431 RepID=A0ACB8X329_9TELE|nr:hypothetical protein L3Q82_006327 [Scortum barcoo]
MCIFWTAMTGLKPTRLRVILGENNTEKRTLPNGIPDSIDELLSKWPEDFPVPRFSYDTELQLEKGNTEYQEIQKKNNEGIIADKMARTFAYRQQEVVNQEPMIQDFIERWSALFREKEINAEFQRLVALPLEQTFLAQIDKTTVQRMSRGTWSNFTTAVFVIRKEGEGLQETPADIGIVIEGMEVLHDLTSVASACAHLLGLVYILNLAYPKPLRFTFEVFQKVFMQLDPHKMSYKVQSLYGRLHSLESCTDVLCCLIFIIVILSYVALGTVGQDTAPTTQFSGRMGSGSLAMGSGSWRGHWDIL